MKFQEFPLVNVGTTGRRALALVYDDGLEVTATDATTAECALQAVLQFMRGRGLGQEADRFASWALQAPHFFPAAPDESYTEHQHTEGASVGQWFERLVAFGYVMPAVNGHQFGGALFDPTTQRPRSFGPFEVRLVSGSRTQ